MPKKQISVIIPAYNEEKRIKNTLEAYTKILSEKFHNFEIIVLTDGCTDKTPEIVKKFSEKRIKHVHPKQRLGKGGAVIKGFELAKGEIIGFVDADCSLHPTSLKMLIETLLKNKKIDGVIASRKKKGARITRKQPLLRRVASIGFNFLVRILFNLHYKDTQCGGKFFRKKAIKEILPEIGLTDWSFDVELLYRLKKKGYKVIELPVVWEHKEGSKLKIGKTSLKMFLSIIGLRTKMSRFHFLAKSPLVKFIYKKVKEL